MTRPRIAAIIAAACLLACGRTGYPATLIEAIRQVESGGNDSAVGDQGRSRGCYQIQAGYWRDATEYGRVTWPYSLVTSRPHAEQVIRWYWQRYHADTDEKRARIHNGGPRGHLKSATLGYWRRVQEAMR